MARPFPLLADNHIRQPVVDALRQAGWDVVHAVDLFGDKGIQAIAHRWLRESRSFRMVSWWSEHRRRMSDGEVVEAIERLATKPNAFAYAIEHIKP